MSEVRKKNVPYFKKNIFRIPQFIVDMFPIFVAVLLTYLTFKFFFEYVPSDKIIELAPNEVGDTLAGLAGTVAFIWLVTSILIQSRELRLQKNEITGLTRQTKLQAQAQARLLLDEKHKHTAQYLKERCFATGEELASLIEELPINLVSYEFKRNPDEALQYIFPAMIDIDESKYDNFLDALNAGQIKNHLTYDHYLAIDSVIIECNTIWRVIKPQWEIALSAEITSEQISFEEYAEIHWIWFQYEMYLQLRNKLCEAVISGKILGASEAALFATKAFMGVDEGTEDYWDRDELKKKYKAK